MSWEELGTMPCNQTQIFMLHVDGNAFFSELDQCLNEQKLYQAALNNKRS